MGSKNFSLQADPQLGIISRLAGTVLEKNFTEIAAVNDLKPGELMLPFRIMLVGSKFGQVFLGIGNTG
ncbi:MAG: hypothetical protein IPI68_11230 [Chitinophagaceae bacterium]|nr:hypothetical protein [Chitinophagaceae bacterium]